MRCVGRGRKTWGEYVEADMEIVLGLQPEWAVLRNVRRDFIHGANV